jgi:hypothetical protein
VILGNKRGPGEGKERKGARERKKGAGTEYSQSESDRCSGCKVAATGLGLVLSEVWTSDRATAGQYRVVVRR